MRLRIALVTALLLAPLVCAGEDDDGFEHVASWPREKKPAPLSRGDRITSISFLGTTAVVFAVGHEVWLANSAHDLGARIRRFDAPVSAVACSPDGELLAVATANVSTVSLISMSSHRRVGRVAGVPWATYLAWSPDGERVLCASAGGEVCIASITSDDDTVRQESATGMLAGAALTTQGPRILEVPTYKHLELSDVNTRCVIRGFEIDVAARNAALSSDGGTIVVVQQDHIFSLLGRKRLTKHALEEPVSAIAISSDATRVCFAGERSCTLTFLDQSEPEIGRHVGAVAGLALSPDGRLALSSGADGTVRLWDVDAGEQVRRVDCAPPAGPVAFSRDGARLLVATRDGVAVLESSGVSPIATVTGAGQPFLAPGRRAHFSDLPGAVAFVGTSTVALLEDSKDGHSRFALVDEKTGERRDAAETTEKRVFAKAFSPGGRRAFVAAPDLEVWDLEKLERVHRYENCPLVIGALGVSEDGRRGAAMHIDRKLRVWRLEAPWAAAMVDASEIGVPSVITFARDGRSLVVGTTDGRFHRFSLPRGEWD